MDTPRVVPTGVPEYDVAWMQANTPYLVVGDTFTGKEIATVKVPACVYSNAVYGTAADDRTFIVTGNRRARRLRGTRVVPAAHRPWQ